MFVHMTLTIEYHIICEDLGSNIVLNAKSNDEHTSVGAASRSRRRRFIDIKKQQRINDVHNVSSIPVTSISNTHKSVSSSGTIL